jgi:hypothetical protein
MSTVQVISEPVGQTYTGSRTVGETAATVGIFANLTRGVELSTATDNLGSIYVSTNASITAGSNDALDGFRIEPGQSIFFPTTNLNRVYLIADEADQSVSFLAY